MFRNWEFPPHYYRQSVSVLETALGQVAAYKSWQAYDPGQEHHIDKRYASLPILTKRDIRENFPQGLVPADRDVGRALANGEIGLAHTSGSSDIRVTNIWNQEWWDASERASWQLNSHASRVATGSHPETILANPLNVGFVSDNADLPMEKRLLSRFLFLNEKADPTKWTPQIMDRMISELESYQPAVLEANPSFLAKLCRYAASTKDRIYQPGMIIFTYEYPSAFHYQQIRRVFSVPMASSYGSTETGYVFMQCEAGKLHQNSESCRVDLQPLKLGHGGPLVCRLLVTTFNNPWYYLLHFDVGDLVRISEEGACSCGRNSGYILSAVEGRILSATLTTDGRLVTLRKLDEALSVLTSIDEYRLEQTSIGAYDLYLVSRRQDKAELTEESTAILKGLYGEEARVSVIYQDSLSPEDSGKYALAKRHFPINIERYLDETS